MRLGRVLCISLLAIAAGTASPAMWCSNGSAVSVGDRKIEVLARCGPPSWKEDRAEETAERVLRHRGSRDVIEERRVLTSVEDWVYNFGPSQLLYFLRFEDGVLRSIETGGYGFAEESPGEPSIQCTSESMAKGRRKIEVLRYCGEPTTVDTREEEAGRTVVDRSSGEASELRKTISIEEWTYNFGPHRLIYVFTFANGKVVAVKTRGYGF